MHASAIKHRNSVKKFFITFPQSLDLTKEDFYNSLVSKYKADKAICVQEQHADGSPHLHLGIEFSNSYTKRVLLLYFQDQYPEDYRRIDVQAMKSLQHTITYLTSPDKDKHVDPNPLLININIEQKESVKHLRFKREFPKDPWSYWAPDCFCDLCREYITEYIKIHKYKPTEIDYTVPPPDKVLNVRAVRYDLFGKRYE